MKIPTTQADQLITIDFETFYDDEYTLKKLTTADYVRDPRFELIGAGVKIENSASQWMRPDEFRVWAASLDWSRCAFLAHHTHFDGLIAAHHYGIRPAVWFDTLSIARALHRVGVGGSLKALLEKYGLGKKGDEVIVNRGKHLRDFAPEEYARYGAYCCNDTDGAYNLFCAMSRNFPDAELWAIDTTIRMFTEPAFVTDQGLLERFLVAERERKAGLLSRIMADKEMLMSNDKFAKLLVDLGETPPIKISLRTGKETFAFAKTDPGMKALLDHEREEVRWVTEARVGVKSTINETRTERLIRAGAGGRPVPVYLNYAGAHTFRWSGGDQMNFQNLERAPKKPDPKKPWAGTLRKALRAPVGQRVVAVDSGQIEARVIAWLARHTSLISAFAEGRDVYSEFASHAYGRPISKADETERFVGKVCILGLGYGMGWHKFGLTLQAGAIGGPPVTFTAADAHALGVDLDRRRRDGYFMRRLENTPSRLALPERVAHFAVAAEFVDRYRAQNSPITALWDLAERAILAMLNDWHMQIGPVGVVRHGLVLPNGLVMRYPGLERDPEADGYTYMGGAAGKERTRIYGGLLVENIVQALARIVVTEQMLEIRARWGYQIATMTHDELVCVVPEAEAHVALGNMLSVMKLAPEWAQGLPLSAEGGIGESYGAAK